MMDSAAAGSASPAARSASSAAGSASSAAGSAPSATVPADAQGEEEEEEEEEGEEMIEVELEATSVGGDTTQDAAQLQLACTVGQSALCREELAASVQAETPEEMVATPTNLGQELLRLAEQSGVSLTEFFMRNVVVEKTRAVYLTKWKVWLRYCDEKGVDWQDCLPLNAVDFLSQRATQMTASDSSTLRLYKAACVYHYEVEFQNQHGSPFNSQPVEQMIRGAKKTIIRVKGYRNITKMKTLGVDAQRRAISASWQQAATFPEYALAARFHAQLTLTAWTGMRNTDHTEFALSDLDLVDDELSPLGYSFVLNMAFSKASPDGKKPIHIPLCPITSDVWTCPVVGMALWILHYVAYIEMLGTNLYADQSAMLFPNSKTSHARDQVPFDVFQKLNTRTFTSALKTNLKCAGEPDVVIAGITGHSLRHALKWLCLLRGFTDMQFHEWGRWMLPNPGATTSAHGYGSHSFPQMSFLGHSLAGRSPRAVAAVRPWAVCSAADFDHSTLGPGDLPVTKYLGPAFAVNNTKMPEHWQRLVQFSHTVLGYALGEQPPRRLDFDEARPYIASMAKYARTHFAVPVVDPPTVGGLWMDDLLSTAQPDLKQARPFTNGQRTLDSFVAPTQVPATGFSGARQSAVSTQRTRNVALPLMHNSLATTPLVTPAGIYRAVKSASLEIFRGVGQRLGLLNSEDDADSGDIVDSDTDMAETDTLSTGPLVVPVLPKSSASLDIAYQVWEGSYIAPPSSSETTAQRRRFFGSPFKRFRQYNYDENPWDTSNSRNNNQFTKYKRVFLYLEVKRLTLLKGMDGKRPVETTLGELASQSEEGFETILKKAPLMKELEAQLDELHSSVSSAAAPGRGAANPPATAPTFSPQHVQQRSSSPARDEGLKAEPDNARALD
jgi:integrase